MKLFKKIYGGGDNSSNQSQVKQNWSSFSAEISAQSNNTKLWPARLRNNAKVFATIQRNAMWTVWKNELPHFAFGIPVANNKYLFLCIGSGVIKVKTGESPEVQPFKVNDDRLFAEATNPHNGWDTIKHLNSEKYIGVSSKKKRFLAVPVIQERASGWILDENRQK